MEMLWMVMLFFGTVIRHMRVCIYDSRRTLKLTEKNKVEEGETVDEKEKIETQWSDEALISVNLRLFFIQTTANNL